MNREVSKGIHRECQTNRRFRLKMSGVPPCERQAEPGLIHKVINFTRSAVRHVAHGRPQAAPEEVQRRQTICDGCEYRTERNTCNKCGCGLKLKTAWLLEQCPLGRWQLPTHTT